MYISYMSVNKAEWKMMQIQPNALCSLPRIKPNSPSYLQCGPDQLSLDV